jgi:Flp pilus assembly protein TadG
MSRRRWRDERGSELVEFALVLPVLLLLMTGIFDFGLIFHRYEVLTNAAREGARLATLPGYTAAAVQERVDAYLAAGGVPGTATTALVIEPLTAGGRTFSVARVTVSYTEQFLFLAPVAALFGGSFDEVVLTAASAMRIESQGS